MKPKCQRIIDTEEIIKTSVSYLVESIEKTIERDKPERHYNPFDLENYKKRFFEKEREKAKTADLKKYSPN